jgi:hypothetical protein
MTISPMYVCDTPDIFTDRTIAFGSHPGAFSLRVVVTKSVIVPDASELEEEQAAAAQTHKLIRYKCVGTSPCWEELLTAAAGH